jgi:hypothetical protein
MKIRKPYWPLVLTITTSLFSLSGSMPVQRLDNDELQSALTRVAYDSLKAEYDVLVTGKRPEYELITQQDKVTRSYMKSEERIAAALRIRNGEAENGRIISGVDVTLIPKGISKIDGKIILHAIEDKIEHYNNVSPTTDSAPQVTESGTKHDFIFTITTTPDCDGTTPHIVCLSGARYLLIEDVLEP